MELDRFLNLTAASIGALGSIYVLRSYLRMTPTATARLAQSGWEFTVPIIDSVSAQRAESVAGAGAFLLALLLGIAGIAGVQPDVPLFTSRLKAFAAAAAIVGIVWGSLHSIARWLRRRHNEAARLVILTETFDEVVNGKKFGSAYLDSVRQTATVLFNMRFDEGEPDLDMMRRVAVKVGRTLPADIEEALDRESTLLDRK